MMIGRSGLSLSWNRAMSLRESEDITGADCVIKYLDRLDFA